MAKVMIVDDEPDLLSLFEDLLKSEGHDVVATASDGEMAIELYKESHNTIDIILMDYRMPKINGLEATRILLNINPLQKIIFISGDFTIRDEAMSSGAIAFIEKPINFKRLIERLSEV